MRRIPGTAGYLTALGVAVRRHRVAKGMSQEEFALAVEIDRTYLSGIERGLRNPTVGTLLRLTKVLGTTPAALLKAAEK